VAAVVVAGLLAVGCASDRTPSSGSASASGASLASVPLRRLAERAHLVIGAAVTSSLVLHDARRAGLVAAQFDSVTPEFEGTWRNLAPTEGDERFGPLDAIVAFAADHRLGVRGHALVWDRADALPGWVRAIRDPARLASAVDRHIRAVVGRYAGRVDRWDVVNEPLQTTGDRLHRGHLLAVLGRRWIADAFRSAHAADPTATLWLNESNVERDPGKASALVDLVAGLVADGVPIDGVGLQMHLLSGRPTQPGVVASLVRRLRALGVDVAVTELDVPRPASGSTAAQAVAYQRVVEECREAGCSEITTWGVDDGHTWLDRELGRRGSDPLLFAADGRSTPALAAVRSALAAPVPPRP
jgi:endo-1,4-beta-xylanase